MKNILHALSQVKEKVGKMSKDSVNPFFKSKYFDINQLLEHVEPLFRENGLILLQPVQEKKVKSIVYHIESGESVFSEIEIQDLSNPQSVGSAITYYRRYTLQSLLGLQAEDDDANKASNQNTVGSPSKNESTNWLNLFDKQGNQTPKYLEIQSAISAGQKFTLEGIRKKYKVSKEVADQLKNNFKII